MAAPARRTHLDPRLFERALSVLERERPTLIQDLLFHALAVLVWVAVALTALYLRMRLRGLAEDEVRLVARLAAAVYLANIPLLALNWPLVTRLRRAARRRRRLLPSWRQRLAEQFSARRRERWLLNLATFVLSVIVGPAITFVGVIGLLVEIPRLVLGQYNPAQLTLAMAAAAFGLSCVFLHFISRGRERLQVVAELRRSLLTSRASGDAHLSDQDYDMLTSIERVQISMDRRESLRHAATAPLEAQFALREHRAVQEAKLPLGPEVRVAVQAAIDRLLAHPPVDGGPGVTYVTVAGTSLEIGISVDRSARELRVHSLQTIGAGGSEAAR